MAEAWKVVLKLVYPIIYGVLLLGRCLLFSSLVWIPSQQCDTLAMLLHYSKGLSQLHHVWGQTWPLEMNMYVPDTSRFQELLLSYLEALGEKSTSNYIALPSKLCCITLSHGCAFLNWIFTPHNTNNPPYLCCSPFLKVETKKSLQFWCWSALQCQLIDVLLNLLLWNWIRMHTSLNMSSSHHAITFFWRQGPESL